MATLAEIRTDVRSRLDEATASYWSDTEIDRWINEAARDFARRAEVLQERADITVTTGVGEYTLPTDTLRVYRVEWRPTGGLVYPLEYRDFHSMDAVWWTQQESQEGYPGYFTMWGFSPNLKIVLYPQPSTAGDIKVFYYRLPAAATANGDTVEVPEGWHDLIALYCEAVSLRKDADPRWQEAKGLYEATLAEYIGLTRRWTDQADSIQPGGLAHVPQWLYEDF